MKPLATTCLVSSYNYAHFVGEAVDGALAQTRPFDEIIVVDDGSTDGSVELLKRRYGGNQRVRIVAKSNKGQLSCFNAGAELAAGDVVFFLDADDVFEPHYVEHALDAYVRHPSCDFMFCARRLFGQQDRVDCRFPRDRDFGYTVLRAAFLREWIGAATSCVSMRRTMLHRILPLPFVDEWRVRADDCLVFGASLAGARKRFLAQPLVRYRVHGDNHFRNRKPDAAASYRRRLAINRLFEHFERKLCYNPAKLAEHFHREFCTADDATLGDALKYLRVARLAGVPLARRIAGLAEMLRRLIQGAAAAPSSHAAASYEKLPPTRRRAA